MHDLLGTRCDPYGTFSLKFKLLHTFRLSFLSSGCTAPLFLKPLPLPLLLTRLLSLSLSLTNPSTVSTVLTGTQYDYHCHSNLTRAIAPYHLSESDIHDVVNIFQITGLDASGRYFMEASPCTSTSFLTFFAEQDLLVALSTCPGGDLSAWGWAAGEGAVEQSNLDGEALDVDERMRRTCREIRCEVLEIKKDVRDEVLRGWRKPEPSGYVGGHGTGNPIGEGIEPGT